MAISGVDVLKNTYDTNGLALLGPGAKCCFVCADFGDFNSMTDKSLILISNIFYIYFIAEETRIRGVDGIIVKTIAKVVPRFSLSNQGVNFDMILVQDVAFLKILLLRSSFV